LVKTRIPISVTVDGMVTLDRFLQLSKAPLL
jgi:hypothetical protein